MIGVTVVAHQAPPASQCGGQPVPGTPILRTYDVDALFQEGIQATLRLVFDPATEANGLILDQLIVYHCDGAGWTAISGPTTVGVQGGLAYVEVSGVTAFSPFALAQPSPLGVTVTSFEAMALANRVEPLWETASELNSAGFNLYRNTAPTIPNEPLAFVPSQAPGSGQGADYRYEDAEVAVGITLLVLVGSGRSERGNDVFWTGQCHRGKPDGGGSDQSASRPGRPFPGLALIFGLAPRFPTHMLGANPLRTMSPPASLRCGWVVGDPRITPTAADHKAAIFAHSRQPADASAA